MRVHRIVARCPGSGIVQRKDLLVYRQVSGKSYLKDELYSLASWSQLRPQDSCQAQHSRGSV